MSEFTDTFESDGLKCPYCGNMKEVEAESYSEDERIHQCRSCNKKYRGC